MLCLSFRLISSYDEHGHIKPKADLLALLDSTGLSPEKETIVYCHRGVSACIGYAALELAGFTNIRMYDGSWAEYSSKEETK